MATARQAALEAIQLCRAFIDLDAYFPVRVAADTREGKDEVSKPQKEISIIEPR